jgi:cytochrome P450
MSPDEHAAMVFYLTFVWYEVCVNAVAGALVRGAGALRSAPPQPVAYRRFATRDVVYGGATIHRGQTVLLSLAAANADPAAADRPHLSFGHGPNRCAGKPVVYALIEEAARPRLTHDLGGLWWTEGLRTRGPRGIRSTRSTQA